MKRKWFRALFRRRIIIALMILVQLGAFVLLLYSGSVYSKSLSVFFIVISLIVSLHIIVQRDKMEYKLTWVFLILLFPVFGGLFYLLLHVQRSNKKYVKWLEKVESDGRELYTEPGDRLAEAKTDVRDHSRQIEYLQNTAGFPVYKNTETEFLPSGERMLEVLLEELKKAEKYIFMEFFIIEEGVMWDSILNVLKEKAAQGVEVRLMYDDMGCFLRLPADYPKQLAQYGIKCSVFNPFRPLLSTIQNNRDHRKIAVVDGVCAITGGVNLADEYINVVEKYGVWKDAALLLRGEAAWSFTLTFLRMWALSKSVREDYMEFYPWNRKKCEAENDGWVIPYADSPLDDENVSEFVYSEMISNASQYLYICTPYLVIDDNMVTQLSLAAKSGVDVCIITPHKWDKWYVHMTTRSYYRDLINAGVRIYEYSEGFIHSKTFVSDDETAVVGTVNMDFRSLYLHFECAAWMCKSKAVAQVKDEFLSTLEICQEITAEDCRCGFFMRLLQNIFRLFAPLM